MQRFKMAEDSGGQAGSAATAEAPAPVESVFEIVDEPVEAAPAAPAEDPTTAKLKEMYDGLESKLGAQVDAKMDRVGEGLASLGESIKGLVAQQGAKPGETPEEFKARVEKSVFDNPIGVIEEVVRRSSAPISEQVIVNQMKMGRRLVEFGLEPMEKGLFRKYSGEIDAEFGRLPVQARFADPEASYQQAFDLVKVRHLGEIIAEERKKVVEEPPKPAPAAPVGVVDRGSRAPAAAAAPKPNQIVLKPGQRGRIEAWMARENVSPSMFNSVVEALHDSGELANI